jgi:hypothetical protein
MDTLTNDRDLVKRILLDHASIPYAYGEVISQPVFDDERGHYALIDVGWEGAQRVHGCLVHVVLRDGKIWIEYDGTEDGVATELMAQGVDKERIVLAFHRPEVRQRSGFAVA